MLLSVAAEGWLQQQDHQPRCGAIIRDSTVINCCDISSSIGVPDSAACMALCDRTPDCTAWDFARSWQVPQCFLHGGHAQAGIHQLGTDSGNCAVSTLCGAIIPDSTATSFCDMRSSIDVPDSAACMALCYQTPDCTAWDFVYSWQVPQCFLHVVSARAGVPRQGTVSGVCRQQTSTSSLSTQIDT